jgi:hypothetical protein
MPIIMGLATSSQAIISNWWKNTSSPADLPDDRPEFRATQKHIVNVDEWLILETFYIHKTCRASPANSQELQ